MISLISILTINHVIGRENTIPWFFSCDRNWFRYHTLTKPVIMGRKTFESIGSKPLPYRLNIILSKTLSSNNIVFNNFIVIDNPEKVLLLFYKYKEIMIIGGSALYRIFLPICKRMYLTYINHNYDYGDNWFPWFSKKSWNLIFNLNKPCRTHQNVVYNLNFQILERCFF